MREKFRIFQYALVLFLAALVNPAYAQSTLPAFPGAEGYGAFAKGGRGGTVIKVTNLNDSGVGSLRACAIASGPRTCIFTVGGTITLSSRIDITNPYLTVAGQTAPGGIQIKMSNSSGGDPILVTTHNVIIRYLTIRPGTLGANSRALSISAGSGATRPNSAHDVIVDHLSTSWSEDEQIIVWYDSYNTTIQNSLIAEGLTSGVQKGPNLGGGGSGSIGGPYTFYGNVVAFFYQRMPRIRVSKPQEDVVDIVNNVIYNPAWNGNYNGAYVSDNARVNLIGNYLKVASGSAPYYVYVESGQVYPKGNITPNRQTNIGDESAGVVSGNTVTTAFVPASGAKSVATPKTALEAYETNLSSAGNSAELNCDGAWIARRDTLDRRIIQDIRSNTGNLVTAAGTWPNYTQGQVCPDTDSDGMPDTYESKTTGLNANVADNNGDIDNDGYTNLEEFLNGNTLGNITPTTTPTGTQTCPNKSKGDADCKSDSSGRNITIVDFEIWRKEFLTGCSIANQSQTSCQIDDDNNGSLIDAEFDTDTKVTIADFQIWRNGYFGGI